jgi:hypothetical protein
MNGRASIKEMFMRRQILGLFVAALVVGGSVAAGDILELKNGTVLDGKYAGGTATTLRFETATVGALVKGETVTIPPGAMLEFTLRAPVTLPSVG